MNTFRKTGMLIAMFALISTPFIGITPVHADQTTAAVTIGTVTPSNTATEATGTPITFTATATGFDGDTPTFSVTDSVGATTATIDASGNFTWTPTDSDVGAHVFTVTAADTATTTPFNAVATENITVVSSAASGSSTSSSNTGSVTPSDDTPDNVSTTALVPAPPAPTNAAITSAPGSTAFSPVSNPGTFSVVANSAKAGYESNILANADRLISLQNANGAWDWVVTDASAPTASTPYNVLGVTAEGLLNAYEISHQQKYLTAAEKAGDYLVTQNGATPSPTQRQNGYSIVFLYDLAAASGNASYKNEANTLLNSIFSGESYWSDNNGDNCSLQGCSAATILAAVENYRGVTNGPEDGIVAWDLAPYVQAEVDAGNTTLAGQIEAEIQSYITNPGYNTSDSDYALGLAAGLSAAHSATVSSDVTTDAATLDASQNGPGNFGTPSDGFIQPTAYALAALTAIGDSHAAAAAAYLGSKFGYTDASTINGWKETDGNEYGEIDSETDRALGNYLYTPNTFYSVQDAINAASTGNTISVGAGAYTIGQLTIPTGIMLAGAGSANTTLTGQITVNAASTTISGFTIANAGNTIANGNGTFGILINDQSNTLVTNNAFTNFGNSAVIGSGNVYGVYFQSKTTTDASNLTITKNTFTNLGTTANHVTNGAIGVGDSTGTSVISNVNISGNTIAGVASYKGAYGIILNHASGATGNTGSTTGVTISGNTISGLNGGWAHAIGLEGNTPNTTVTGNTISHLTATGGDAAAVHFDTNSGASSVSIQKNNFDTSTMAFGISSSIASAINATQNYWNSANPAAFVIAPSGSVMFSPWYTDAAMSNLAFTTTSNGGTQTTQNPTPIQEAATSTVGAVNISIPAGTTITSDANWNGQLQTPTFVTPAPFTVNNQDVTVRQAIEVGSPTSAIQLSNAARLDFVGQAGKGAGWISTGGAFTLITVNCLVDSQAWADTNLAPGADCTMADGNDLIIWTKHFTTFTTFDAAASLGTSTGGGSGGGSGSSGGSVSVSSGTSGGTSGGSVSGGSTGGQVLGASTYNFATNLMIGMTSDDVTQLQTVLIADGYLKIAAPTGYFGALTKAAVIRFQAANGLPTTGFVGVMTRGILNQGTTPTTADETASMKNASIQAQISALQAQLQAMMTASSTSK